jgi:hypothetical protein
MGLSVQRVLSYADEVEETGVLNRIVTGDKSWMHHHQPESERASVQYKHPSSSSTKKFKVTTSTVFWDFRDYC